MWTRGVLGVVGWAVLGMTLAGCDGSPDSSAGDPTSPSPAPTSTEPTDPDHASPDAEPGEDDEAPGPDEDEAPDPDEKAAAVAFVYDYLSAYNEAMETGDTALVGGLAAQECDGCSASIRRVKQLHAAGETVEGGQFADPEVRYQSATDDRIELAVITDVTAVQVLDDEGAKIDEHPAHLRLRLAVAVEPDGVLDWQIVSWEDDPALPTPTPEP